MPRQVYSEQNAKRFLACLFDNPSVAGACRLAFGGEKPRKAYYWLERSRFDEAAFKLDSKFLIHDFPTAGHNEYFHSAFNKIMDGEIRLKPATPKLDPETTPEPPQPTRNFETDGSPRPRPETVWTDPALQARRERNRAMAAQYLANPDRKTRPNAPLDAAHYHTGNSRLADGPGPVAPPDLAPSTKYQPATAGGAPRPAPRPAPPTSARAAWAARATVPEQQQAREGVGAGAIPAGGMKMV